MDEEIDTLQSIFEELEITSEHSVQLKLPIALAQPLEVLSRDVAGSGIRGLATYLPSLTISLNVPAGYPESAAPVLQVSTCPKWLPDEVAARLAKQVVALWEDYGRSEILYASVAHVMESSEEAFGLDSLQVDDDVFSELMEHNRLAELDHFRAGTYTCDICLDPKKGSQCHRVERCGHIFCVECLQDCYVNAILTGDTDSVKCPAVNCGTENDDTAVRRSRRATQISPQELLRIPIERPAVQRYVNLRRKRIFEADPSTIWCPRQWCQGPAINKEFPKPTLALEAMDDAHKASFELPQPSTPNPPPTPEDEVTREAKILADRLRVCEDCSFAYCKLCRHGWHGDYFDCRPRTDTIAGRKQIDEETKASDDWIAMHTSPCPCCRTAIQKSEACNHMRCTTCRTHFCYLCGFYLDPTNPYKHFNIEGSPCYQRLWVLEEGDDGVSNEVRFGGARGAEMAARGIVPGEEDQNADAPVPEVDEGGAAPQI